MAINDQIRDEKRKYDVNRKALLLGKIDKYEYLLVKKYYHLINKK